MSATSSFGTNYCGIQVGINNGSINYSIDKEGMKTLPFVDGAVFDSYENQHDDECLPGTRTEILAQIDQWASTQGPCIFWLNGMAGTGKSTISRTVARSFSSKGALGASFFFQRGEADRGNALKLFPTVARQLAFSIPELHPFLQQAVLDNPAVAGKGIREQFDKLLLQPLICLAQSDLQKRALVVVVDALDECDGDNNIRLVLQLLSDLRKISTLHLKVFLTSRPELPIRLGFSEIATSEATTQQHQDLILHEIPEEVIKHDISLFFHHRLSTIRSESLLSDDWPGDTDFWKLVNLSIPLFIFAATICRLFEDPNWDPIDSLAEVLAHRYDSNLDQTYLPILNRILAGQTERQKRQLIEEFQQVVGSIVILESPLSITSLSNLLGLPKRLIQLRLKLLHSVLQIPPEGDEDSSVRVFHLSFKDFLLDPETRDKTPLSIDKKEACYNLTIRCLVVCQNQLRKNICELPGEGTHRADIDQSTIDRHVPLELQYACRYWVCHLLQCDLQSDGIIDRSFSFLQKHFLHWVEALSLLGLVSEVVVMLDLLRSGTSSENHREMSDFLHDAKRFILKNRQIADEAPLQIYSAGLTFAPKGSIVRQTFEADIPSYIRQLPQVEDSWSPEIQTLEGHSLGVTSVAFSPDGLLLASASNDCTVRLWDPATGALQQTIEHNSGTVSKVVFSPNGCVLASVSRETIHLWDPTTGALQRTLEPEDDLGHVSSIEFSPNSHLLASTHFGIVQIWDPATGALHHTLKDHLDYPLAFSPDGHLLATAAASENFIRLWDPVTGALQYTLKGHLRSIYLVVFSPNGELLASTSEDGAIGFWDLVTGTLRHVLEGHFGAVRSVVFSPDSRLLAATVPLSGTVRLWDSTTGALRHVLKGHWSSIHSLAFSPGGNQLASGSLDKTVRLWDPATGALQQTLKGHLNLVGKIAFSPNGQLLASVSEDRTIRLWDPTKGPVRQKLDVHASLVEAVALSSDGLLLASGSRDGIVRVWDSATGTLQQTLEGHSDTVSSVAFSPDGQLLASGSDDQTVRLWDLATGALQRTLDHQSGGAIGCNIQAVTVSPDSCILASGSQNSTVWLWDLATGALQQKLKGHRGSVSSVAFSSDGRLLASGSYDQTVRLWDLTTGALQQSFSVHEAVQHLGFTQDSLFLKSSLGLFGLRLQSGGDNRILMAPQMIHDIWIRGRPDQFTERTWIELKGEKRLWLPMEFRPTCFAMNGNLLAMGHASGQVSFLAFDI